MTTIEAIKELREASDSEVRYGDTKRHYNEVMKRVEAFDMAIKALEEVSRLPENLHREREQAYMNGYADGKSTCRWISVDDKLPEENQRVLVIYMPLISDTEKIDIDFIKGKYWQNHGGVVAWMPLPEWEGIEYDEERNTMTIKKSAYDDAVERIEKSTFTLHDGLDCVETLVALEAVMIASAQTKPCEDCVSRKLLSDNICEGILCNECSFNEIDGECGRLLQKRFDELPSVQPIRSTGKWIVCDVVKFGDFVGTEKYECSKCHHRVGVFKSNFCPNCGSYNGGYKNEADN